MSCFVISIFLWKNQKFLFSNHGNVAFRYFCFSLEKPEIYSTNTENLASTSIGSVLDTTFSALTNWPLGCVVLSNTTRIIPLPLGGIGCPGYSISVHLHAVTISIIRSALPVFVKGKSTTADSPCLSEPMLIESFSNVISGRLSKSKKNSWTPKASPPPVSVLSSFFLIVPVTYWCLDDNRLWTI